MNKKETVCYGVDASRIEGKVEKVFFPKSAEDVCNIVKSSNFDVVPRGSGTGLVGGCVPNNSIVVDMSKMNKVTNFNPRTERVRAEAGVSVKELNEKLMAVGFEFPIYYSNLDISKIGSMVAINSSGNRSIRYGSIKDWIEEIEFVNGRGELMKTGKSDSMDICGMEGITGIIVAVTLRIKPFVRRSASIFQSEDLDEVLSIARRLKLEKEVVMIELFSPHVSRLMGFPEKYNVIIEFDSDRGKVKGEEYKSLIELKDKVRYAFTLEGYYNSYDPKFFFDKLREFISFLDLNEIPYFGYLGRGVVYPFFKDDEKDKMDEVINFFKKINVKFSEYGVGLTRKDIIDSFEKKILQRVKLRHDPFLKLNKGKIIDIDDSAREVELYSREERKDIKDEPAGEKVAELLKTIKPSEGERETALRVTKEILDSEKKEEITQSELPKKDMKNVEEFNRNLLIKAGRADESEESKKTIGPEYEKVKSYDYDTIRKVMTNQPVDNRLLEKDGDKKDSKDDRLLEKDGDKKDSRDEDEKDLINRIMMNKFDEDK